MEQKFNFCLANIKNKDEILALYRGLLGTITCTWDESYPSMTDIISDIKKNSLFCLKNGNDIVAVAFCGQDEELSCVPWKSNLNKPVFFARLGVARSMHGKGLGSLMVRKVIEVMKNKGHDGIRLLVSPTNPPALALYNKLGFTNIGSYNAFGHDWFCYELKFLI